MPESVVIDELHLTVRVPSDLPEEQAGAVRHALAGTDFMTKLRRAVRAAVRAVPALAAVRVAVTR